MTSRRLPAAKGTLLVAGTVALGYGLAATAIARSTGVTTTYPGHSAALAWAYSSAGLALMLAGVAIGGRHRGIGALALLAGIIWFTPIWEGWENGPAFIRTAGMLATSFVFPVLVHLVCAAAGWPLSRAASTLVWSTYALIGLCAVLVALTRDPYLDPYCWANCSTNVFEVSSQPELARRIGRAQSWITTAVATALTIMCIARSPKAVRMGPRRSWQVLPGGAALGVATIAYGILLRRQPLEDPGDGTFAAIFLARCGAVVLIAVGVVAPLLTTRSQRRSVARIIATLDEAPPAGSVGAALARLVGDPRLRISYWLPSAGHYADAHGVRVADPLPTATRTTTALVRNGHTVAVVEHHVDPADLERGIGPAVRLALDNERLQSEVRARMHELTSSRARIVEAADSRRRSLERNLHDGAQQSLLSMSYDLKRAQALARASSDAELAALIDATVVEVREAFHELRDLAHGIYPAVLAAAGLCPAIAALADGTELAVDVDCAVDGRVPSVVESAGYLLVATGFEAAAATAASHVTVAVTRRAGSIAVDITHDGADWSADVGHVGDRVGAVGGRLVVTANTISAELPCAS